MLKHLPTIACCGMLLLGGCASVPPVESPQTQRKTDADGKSLPISPLVDAAVEDINQIDQDGDTVAAARSGAAPPVRQVQPELEFPEVDLSNLPIREPGSSMAAGNSGFQKATVAGNREDDLWQRLRGGFRMSKNRDLHQRVRQFETWYAKHPKYFERLASRAYWFLPYVLDQVEARGMPTEVAILPAIESAFRPDATSRSKAVGMWQFIGATGRRFGLRQDWWMDARRDLVQSTRAALDYLEYLNQEFNGDWELAFAAYNAGEGGINRRIKKNRQRNLPTSYAYLQLRRETAEYVPRLLALRNILAQPERFGIQLKPLKNEPSLAVVDLKAQTDISVAASFSSLSQKQLHFLNLGYKRGVTPPNGPHTLVVPIDEAKALSQKIAALSPTQRMRWAHHRVKSGEYLGRIAKAHNVTVRSIKLANSLNSNLIRPGPGASHSPQHRGDSIRRTGWRKPVSEREETLGDSRGFFMEDCQYLSGIYW